MAKNSEQNKKPKRIISSLNSGYPKFKPDNPRTLKKGLTPSEKSN